MEKNISQHALRTQASFNIHILYVHVFNVGVISLCVNMSTIYVLCQIGWLSNGFAFTRQMASASVPFPVGIMSYCQRTRILTTTNLPVSRAITV